MQLQAVTDAPGEGLAHFRTIPALLITAFHPAFLVDYAPFDNPVSDGLSNDILGVLFRVKVELDANIAQGYP